jgi:FixJ family two-component response regulator
MRKQKLLQRLVAALAKNKGIQSKRTEIWQRLESLTPREVDVLCYLLRGQLNRERHTAGRESARQLKAERSQCACCKSKSEYRFCIIDFETAFTTL